MKRMTTMRDDDYEIINKTMEALKYMDIPLKRTALCVVIDTGITTQETKYTYYRVAVNTYNMLKGKQPLTIEEEAEKVSCGAFTKVQEEYYNKKWIEYRKTVGIDIWKQKKGDIAYGC